MKAQLKKLIIKNFKGIKSLEIDFDNFEHPTNIEGANRSKKTTVFDSVHWLLFGKDSKGKQEFNIKPLNKNNETTPKLETKVFSIFDVDGKELRIKRTRKEDWTKPRGQLNTILTGHTTFYEWNDSDIPKAEFEKRRDKLIEEKLFKLVTNPLFFNSLDWKVRRMMLTDLTPGFKFESKSKFSILSDKGLEEKRKQIASQIKKTKDELKLIPVRVDEANVNKPGPQKWDELFASLQNKQQDLITIENQIVDKSKVLTKFNESRMKEQKELTDLKNELDLFISNFESKHNQELRDLEITMRAKIHSITIIENEIGRLKSNIESCENSLKFGNNERNRYLKEWHELNEKEFKEGVCSACGQDLPQENIKDLKIDFDSDKENNLEAISDLGKKIALKIGGLTQKIKNYNISIESEKTNLQYSKNESADLEAELKTTETPDIEKNKQYKTLSHLYNETKEVFEKDKAPKIDVKELKVKKAVYILAIDGLKKALNKRTQIAEIESRIKDLEKQEETKSTILVGLEKTEFAIESFVKAKISALETEINKKFKLVKFKMFESQINGGEKEVCQTLFNGVPWHDTNSEAKINGGLDIINTFSKHYDISAPIFIDNRESTTDIIETEAQIINLIVNPKHKTLKIS